MRKLNHAEIPRPSLSEISSLRRHPVVAVLDNIRSVHNVGAIFRTSDALLVEHLYLCGITATPDTHPDIQKTALGAQDTVPWSYHSETSLVLQNLRERSYTIAALEIANVSRLVQDIQQEEFPMALVVGHEVFGVSDAAMCQCDFALELPQFGVKQSLNVSVAYGIALYGLAHQLKLL
ncbi:MAG: RNA methyltransferase [Bacteroidetes Order II. Incertae sedis bacterium]|nr:RNA methyltransferase [Bacteroidetes Order II. bacterium]